MFTIFYNEKECEFLKIKLKISTREKSLRFLRDIIKEPY